MNFIIKYRLTLAGVTIGAIGGFLYYYYIGCDSGTCAITSKPLNSSLYGALLGGLTSNMIRNESKIKKNEN